MKAQPGLYPQSLVVLLMKPDGETSHQPISLLESNNGRYRLTRRSKAAAIRINTAVTASNKPVSVQNMMNSAPSDFIDGRFALRSFSQHQEQPSI